MNTREEYFICMDSKWNTALLQGIDAFSWCWRGNVDLVETFVKIASNTIISLAEDPPSVLGLAGSWAVGKGYVGNEIIRRHGYERLVLTTTRSPRPNEIDGVDYHFVGEDVFHSMGDDGDLISSRYIEWRWWYWVTWESLQGAYNGGRILVEWGPSTIKEIFKRVRVRSELIYLLPNAPIMEELQRRFFQRCSDNGMTPTDEQIDSTLGVRQIEEFLEFVRMSKDGLPTQFEINTIWEDTVDKFR